uniref:Odorant receptor n=1 Tax=Aulacocentrum confusum TaxID=2767324 RepID=A0A7G8Z920_9HYME|nr:olfactory receptor 1 [Aulacocentrum confusum]
MYIRINDSDFILPLNSEVAQCRTKATLHHSFFYSATNQQPLSMSPLDYNFKILHWCGLWKTDEWLKGRKNWIYNFYTVVVCFFVFGMTGLGLLETFLSWKNLDVAIDNLFVMLSITSVCAKMITFLVYKKPIVELFKILDTDMCHVRNSKEEKTIEKNFNRLIWFRTKVFATMAQSTVALLILNFFIIFAPDHDLPYKIWLPGNLSTFIGYRYLLFYEIIATILANYVNITYDTMLPGIMILACKQFSLLKHRALRIDQKNIESNFQSYSSECVKLNKIKKPLKENKIFATCIEHQLLILKFIDTTKNIFGYTICVQYSVSGVTLCLTIYKLAKVDIMNPIFGTLIVYTSALLVQIFMLCIAATELTFYSCDFCSCLYEVEWYALTLPSKMNIMFMMVQTTKPLKFTCMKFINVSLDSFFHLLKVSYSAYNVLKTSSY